MTHQEAHKQSRAFAKQHLKQCCQEIIDWKKTGTLVEGGKVREIEAMIEPFDPDYATRQAEQVVIDVALEQIAAGA